MTNKKNQDAKPALQKIGKAIWSALPWLCMWIGLVCWFTLLFMGLEESVEKSKQLAALEAENARYEAENTRLDEEIDWLRSLVEQMDFEEVGDGQVQP